VCSTARTAFSSAREHTILRAYNPKQMFDATTKKCVEKKKIAVPTDCQVYKECVSIEPSLSMEYWREASCPTSTHFNPSTATCVMSNESDCCKYLLKSRTLTQHIGKGCKQFLSLRFLFQKVKKLCLEDTCQNGGICRETSRKNYECLCKEEFFGLNCECK